MILAVFLFMRNMVKFSNVSAIIGDTESKNDENDNEPLENFTIPKQVEVYEITGPYSSGLPINSKMP
jgi:SulP family sulfate permease